MGTLSFSNVASSILSSVPGQSPTKISGSFHKTAATGVPHIPASFPKVEKDSEFCLTGKLDLSMWRDIGNEEDDEEQEEDEDLEFGSSAGGVRIKVKKAGGNESKVLPLPPPSPILTSLLGTKSRNEEHTGKLSRALSPNPKFSGTQENNSLGTPASPWVVVIGGVHQQSRNNKIYSGRGSSTTLLPPSSSLSPNPNHHENRVIEFGGVVTPSSKWSRGGGSDDGGSARHAGRESQAGGGNRELSLLLRQQNQFTTDSSITSKQGEPQEQEQVVEAQEQKLQTAQALLPLLSSFIGSTQLSRHPQFPNGGVRDRGIRSARKVGFPKEQILMMEQQATETAQAKHAAQMEKAKRSESVKDGSVTTRSRSGSTVRRSSSKTVPIDVLQEIRKMSLASQDVLEEKKKSAAGSAPVSGRKFGKKPKHTNKRKPPDEIFTDKDRAAAVTSGSKDIKHSLKAKKKRDTKMRLSISFLSGEDYVVGALLGEASYQMKIKNQPEAALRTLNKALEIQPNHKGALVARSQCYLKLGDAEAALKDAELTWDPNNQNDRYIQGLYQYAEALYQLGEFEKALIAFHRGNRIRKDQDGFRIGIQKSQEAIKRAIGDRKATSMPNLDTILPLIQKLDERKAKMSPEERHAKNDDKLLQNIAKHRADFVLSSPADMKVKSKLITRELMGQLYLDKSYLKKFITRPEVINQQGLAKGLRDEACEALNYLESRESFWRQQNPLYSRKNFKTMLKAHSHGVACRKQSVSEEPSVAKYLQRQSSVLVSSSPPLLPENEGLIKRRSSSEVHLSSKPQQNQRTKSVERGTLDKTEVGNGTNRKNGGQVKSLKKKNSVDNVKSKNGKRP